MTEINVVLADIQGALLEAWHEEAGDTACVTTHEGSIFEVACDALVSPANSFGFMDGGLDLAISRFFGWHVQERLQDKIQRVHHGELLVGAAEIVPTNHAAIPFLISAPTMRVPMILKNTVNVYLAIRGLLLLVKHGRFEDGSPITERVRTVAMPGMGTGIGQVTPQIFARQMKRAVEEVLQERHTFPESWWDAAKRHQLLYGDSAHDLQGH